MTRSGFVCFIGRPNVGKSTLMNHLIGQKIAITSEKPQTTRKRIETVYTDERGQVIFLDTPGMGRAKNKLGDYMLSVAENALSEVDVVCWLVEPNAFIGEAEQLVIDHLSAVKVPILLVINKIDLATPEQVAACHKAFEQVLPIRGIAEVSALRSLGTKELLDKIFALLPEGPLYYDEDTLTDQPVRDIAAEMIREKALRLLKDEVPHGIAVVMEQMKERDDGIWDVQAAIVCEKESHKGIIIGRGGETLKRIGTGARIEMEKLLDAKVNLKLWVKVRKEWRNDETQLRSFGYQKKKHS